MNPREYVETLHDLSFVNPRTGLAVNVELTEYGAGWGTDAGCNRPEMGTRAQAEYARFATALRVLHHGSSRTPCGSKFFFDQRSVDGIDPSEPFFARGLVRAFNGKGSPDEIIDTLRLGLATGRIGSGRDTAGQASSDLRLPEYVRRHFSLDCNGLVGNFLGIDPDTPPSSYCVPERRRRRVGEIARGDSLVTHHGTKPFEHIAMVHQVTVDREDTDGTGRIVLEICEWGNKGTIDQHYKAVNAGQPIEVRSWPMARFGLGFASGAKFRYFFAPPDSPRPRGWGLRGDPAL